MRISRGESVRTRALTAAGTILNEEGADGLSLRLLAERAGVGLASIYHHFESKDDLLLHLALRGYSELAGELERSRARTGLGGPMRRVARAYLDFADRRAPLFALMFDTQMLARHETLREAEREVFGLYEAAVRADSRVPEALRTDTATAVWALGRGMISINASHPGGRMPREMSDQMSRGIAWLLDRKHSDAD